jgi:hypothetical protein
MRVAGSDFDSREAALLQPLKQVLPALSGLSQGDLEAENLPIALLADADDDQGLRRPHRPLPADLDAHRIGHHERIVALQRPLGPGLNLLVELLSQVADRLPAELPTAKLGGDLFDSAGGHSLDYHLHQRRHQRLLRSLIALEQFGAEGPLSIARYLQLKLPDSRGQLPLVRTVSIPTALVGLLSRLSPEVLGHFCLQNLVHDGLEEHFGSLVAE